MLRRTIDHATYAHLTLARIQVQDGVQHCGQQEQDQDEGDCDDDGEVGQGPGEAALGGQSPVPEMIQALCVLGCLRFHP